jgi:hypothetical protein
MTDHVALTALFGHLCARRSALVHKMAANPEQVTREQLQDRAALQTAFPAVEAEQRKAERETLHEEVQQRLSSYA